MVEVMELGEEKIFQRFFPMERADFRFPAERSDHYTVIELSIFAERPVGLRKQLIKKIFSNIEQLATISSEDIEIILIEVEKTNWGLKGITGDEL